MNSVLMRGEAPARINRTQRSDNDWIESQLSLQRASLVLRAIRERYETGRERHPDARCYSVHVALDVGDVAWITAAIGAVENTIAERSVEVARPAALPPRNRRPGLGTIPRAPLEMDPADAMGALILFGGAMAILHGYRRRR